MSNIGNSIVLFKTYDYELVFPRFDKLYWQENRDGADGAIPDQLFSGACYYQCHDLYQRRRCHLHALGAFYGDQPDYPDTGDCTGARLFVSHRTGFAAVETKPDGAGRSALSCCDTAAAKPLV
jgi:hypothetical protein